MANTLHNFQASRSPIRRAWRNDALWVDVVVVSAICVLGEFAARRNWLSLGTNLSAIKGTLYTTDIQVFAAVLGFLIAGSAVLIASSGLEKLKVASYKIFKLLVQSFRDSMYCLLGAIAFTVAVMILDQSAGYGWAVVAVSALILVLLRIARAARRLYLTMLI